MFHSLHAPSLYIATACVEAIAALLMLRILMVQRDPFLGFWTGYAALFSVACVLLGLRSQDPDAVVVVVGASLALGAIPLIWLGACRLRGRAPSPWLALLPPAVWLLLCGPALAWGGMNGLLLLYSGLALALVFGAARECWLAHRASKLGSVRDLALLLSVGSGWYVWRILEAGSGAGEVASPLAALVGLVMGGSIAFLGLAIGRERAAEAAAEALRRGQADMERLHAGLPAIIFLREIRPDLTSRRLYWGGDIEAVAGWSRQALAGLDSWVHLSAPETSVKGLYERTLRDGEARLDWRMRQPDGNWNWMRSSLRVLERRADGSALAVGYIVNIETERTAADRAEAARLTLDSTLAAAPVAVFRGWVTPDGGFTRTYLSRGIERLTGWPWEQINAPGGLQRILAPEKQAQVSGNMLALIETGESRKTYRLRRADGSWMWARTTLAVLEHLPDGGAEVVGYIADVTPEREAEAKAVTAARLASLGEMSSGLAHELMQPLLTISLASENALRALERDDFTAARPRLDRIIQQVRRAKDLVEHFRRFARGTPSDLTPGPVALEAAVDGALVLVGAGLRQAGVEVEIALGAAPLPVLGHAMPLEQVLVNLLSNARDALESRPADQPRRVRIAATPAASGLVTLTVADTAGGIPDSVMARLFEPFVSTKDPDRGTGLGLSICHRLVKAMGGKITARNDDQGAVFSITLATAPAAAAAAVAVPA